nr:mandelate racemase/muconate lactonizing enzyme family protein [Jiella sonneratiae]
MSRVLGGALRDRLTPYASGPLLPPDGDRHRGLAAAVESYARQNYRAVKLRVGIGPAADEVAIRRAREILGPDRDLMIDLNEASTVHDALTLARRIDDLDLRWIEEPVRHDDLPSYRELAARLTVPLAGGESFCGLQAFRDPVAERSLSILQPDIALCGGITETLKIAALAEASGLALIPHVWGAAVNVLAAMQVAAVLPDAPGRPLPQLECDMSHNPMRDAIFAPRPDPDGTLAVPDGPGLGIEIDTERLEPFVTDHWTVA